MMRPMRSLALAVSVLLVARDSMAFLGPIIRSRAQVRMMATGTEVRVMKDG